MAKSEHSLIKKSSSAEKHVPAYKKAPAKTTGKRKHQSVTNAVDNPKQKHKVKDVPSDDEVESKLPALRLRTTPAQFAKVMCSLTPEKKVCVTRLGFRSLIGFNIDQLPGNLVYYVVDNFDGDEMIIKTQKRNIKVDSQAVHDVFGLEDVGTDIDTLELKLGSLFVQNWLNQFPPPPFVTRSSSLCSKILTSTEVDSIFQMNFIMLFASTMVSCERNGKVSSYVLMRLSDDVDISSINWSMFLLSSLKYSKNGWNRNDPNCFYTGAATFLTLLYLDRTKFDSFPVVRGRPVFKNWKGAIAVRAKKEAELRSFGLLELSDEYDEEAENGEGFLKLEDEDKADMCAIGGYCEVIEEKFKLVNDLKHFLSRTIRESLSKYPDEKILISYEKKLNEVFKMDVCDVKTDDEMEDESEGKDDDDVNNDESEGKDDDDEKKAESEGTDDDDDDDDDEKNADSEKKDDECVDVNKVESEKKIDDGQSKADDDVNDEQEVNLDSDDPIVPVVTEVVGPKVAEKDVDKDQNEEEYTSLTQWFNNNVNEEDKYENKEYDEAVKLLDKGKLASSPEVGKMLPKQTAVQSKKFCKKTIKKDRTIVLRSAYINKLTVVSDILTNSALILAMELFSMKLSPSETVFESRKGSMIHHLSLESLCPDVYAEASVIDLWSFILNEEQKYRGQSSPSRFFFPSSIIYSYLYDNKNMKKEDKLMIIKESANAWFRFFPKLASLRKVDLVFFPICRHGHFFVLVIDMKVPKLYIPDNSSVVKNYAARYAKVFNLLLYAFAEHLKFHKHPFANQIEKLERIRISLPWKTIDNVVDCGVFAMFHIDMFKARSENEWSDVLVPESAEQKNQLRKLRIRYASKILSHDLNIHAEQMLRNARNFAAFHEKKDYRKVIISAKTIKRCPS
ncbi:uncharacterized protein [Rutidosis leptorrhynchoides]|uniref:uncharacterized protein n=1 Tax=Rutidosis leptorrhynchoides TaxID=125765 RepID=UPI003A9A2042